jgi:hypothetical protein
MKTTHLVLLTSALILLCSAIRAQVKIGDNPLQISDNRLLEIEEGGEYFLVKDSSGMTIGRAVAPTNDPLMLKLFGYGEAPSRFAPGGANGNQDYFLGTNSNGEIVEFPLLLNLNSTTNPGELSINNGDILFGSVQLDSVFASDNQLSDSISTIRTLVASSDASDGDTITGNEWIRNLDFGGPGFTPTSLVITENIDINAPVAELNTTSIDFDLLFTTDIDFDSTITNVRNELADTAAVLREFNFYLNDNTFDDPTRTASGGGITNLSFDDLSEFNVSNTPEINLNSTTGNISLTSDDANVTINSPNGGTVITTGDLGVQATGNGIINYSGSSTLRSDGLNSVESTTNTLISAGDVVSIEGGDSVSVAGIVKLDNYGQGLQSGSESFLIATDAAGNLIEVDISDIGGDAELSGPVDLDEDGVQETTVDEAIQAADREIDSTIYNFDGILTGERTMDMNAFGLTFQGDSADETQNVYISPDGRMAIGRNTVTAAVMAGREVKLDVNGDILAIQVHSSSDERFKKNINTVDNALAKVQELRGVTYDFRTAEFEDKNFPEYNQLGFIAQEVEAVIPQVVRTDSEGYKAVDYAKITALLTQAIKEQQDIINAQKAKIASQEESIELQANRIDHLAAQTNQILNLIQSPNHLNKEDDFTEK